jgi:GH24 family phage-related lysozyme (muramidase)
MKTSQEGIELLKSFEGCVLTAYWDYKGYSIGYGHLGAKKGQTITKEQAEELLKQDLPSYEAKVMKYDNIYHWTQNEFDALVSYCYNIGSIKGLVDDGKRTRAEIVADWTNHDRAGGQHLDSLKKRRIKELELFTKRSNNMTEKDITICGHGSGTPSYKNMYTYFESRYNSIASNGKHKGIVAVRRLKNMTDAKREIFKQQYASIIGRNIYSQNLREYCYTMYKGKYYSDCSSSGIKTYEKCGFSFPWTLNTAGIYESNLFETVPVIIKNGHITNPEILKVGDALLFVGNDPKRPLQIGHVEYVYNIPNTKPEYPKWVKSGSDWYYRIAEDQNAHGWMKIAETNNPKNVHWYYFDNAGKMLSDWFIVNDKWYYAQPSGSLEGALWKSDSSGAQSVWYV